MAQTGSCPLHKVAKRTTLRLRRAHKAELAIGPIGRRTGRQQPHIPQGRPRRAVTVSFRLSLSHPHTLSLYSTFCFWPPKLFPCGGKDNTEKRERTWGCCSNHFRTAYPSFLACSSSCRKIREAREKKSVIRIRPPITARAHSLPHTGSRKVKANSSRVGGSSDRLTFPVPAITPHGKNSSLL